MHPYTFWANIYNTAKAMFYDGSTSGLLAKNVQDAIDEIVATSGGKPFATTLVDPALNSITQAMVDDKSGVVITLTGAGNSQTLPAPTDTTPGNARFVVVNNDSSTHPIDIIGGATSTLDPGKKVKAIWEGTTYAFSEAEGILLDNGTDIYFQNSTRNLDLQDGGLKDTNVTTAVKVGSAIDTSLTTTKKDILGGINELDVDKANDNEVVHLTGNESIAGEKTFTNKIILTANTEISESSGDSLEENTSATNDILRKLGDNAGATSHKILNSDDTVVHEVTSDGTTISGATGVDGIEKVKNSGGDTKVQLNSNGDSYINGGNTAFGDTTSNTTIRNNGDLAVKRTAVGAADYNPSVATTDYIIAMTDTSAARNVIIPTEDVQKGTTANPIVKRVVDEGGLAGANAITITLENGGTINGAANYQILANHADVCLYLDGTNAHTMTGG